MSIDQVLPAGDEIEVAGIAGEYRYGLFDVGSLSSGNSGKCGDQQAGEQLGSARGKAVFPLLELHKNPTYVLDWIVVCREMKGNITEVMFMSGRSGINQA